MDGDFLFSLEVFVEDIEYLSVPCNIPAVAFRFLDYPTIIIYFTSLSDIEQMREKLGSYSQTENDVTELNKLRDSTGRYAFNKGKSCLFKHDIISLNQLLNTVPLYIMVVDSWADRPKLVGSCIVPMQQILSQIQEIFEQHSENCPAIGYRSGKYQISNLMGTDIGKINLRVKLTCFGSSLLKHVKIAGERKTQIDLLLDKDMLDYKSSNGDKNLITVDNPKLKEKNQKITHTANKSIQCLRRAKTKKKDEKRKTEDLTDTNIEGDFLEFDNIVCPPPLYMNLKEPLFYRQSPFKVMKKKHAILETDLIYDSISSDQDVDIEILRPQESNIQRYDIMKLSNDPSVNNKPKPKEIKTDTGCDHLSDIPKTKHSQEKKEDAMPVLCALLKEITNLTHKLTGSTGCNHDLTHSAVDSSIPTLKNEIESCKQCCHCKHGNDVKSVGRKNSKSEKQQSTKCKVVAKFNNQTKTQKKSLRKVNFPDGKLEYGFTRTQRLRYKLSHQNENLPENSSQLHYKGRKSEKANAATVVKAKRTFVNMKPESSVPKETSEKIEVHNDKILAEEKMENTESNLLKNHVSTVVVDQSNVSLDEQDEQVDLKDGKNSTIDLLIPISEQNLIEAEQDDDSFHNEIVPKNAGFYSPVQPRSISISELGIFDDQSPWPSVSKTPENYDDESFHSDHSGSSRSLISVTSTVSLPNVSDQSERSDDTIPIPDKKSIGNTSNERDVKGRISSKLDRSSMENNESSSSSNSSSSSSLGTKNKEPIKSSHSPVKSRFFKRTVTDDLKTSMEDSRSEANNSDQFHA